MNLLLRPRNWEPACGTERSAASANYMGVLPGVLGCCTLRRTVQVRRRSNTLRLPGGTPIFTVSRHTFMKNPGKVGEAVQLESAAGWSSHGTSRDEKAEEQKEKKETAFLFLAP